MLHIYATAFFLFVKQSRLASSPSIIEIHCKRKENHLGVGEEILK